MKRIFSLLMTFCLLLSMVPTGVIALEEEAYSVSTTIGDNKFFTGEATEFTVTTHVSEGAEQKTVVGAFELYDSEGNQIENVEEIKEIVTLKYQEYPSGNLIEFYGEFGPATGFPMMDGITSIFQATFHKEGTYTVKVYIKEATAERNVVCSVENVISVQTAEITTNLTEQPIFINDEVEFTVTTVAHAYTGKVKGTFEFSNPDAIETLKYYDTQTKSFLDFFGDFGPADGFVLQNATSTFRVKFKTAGEFTTTISIKDMDGNVVCSTGAINVNVQPKHKVQVVCDEGATAKIDGAAYENAVIVKNGQKIQFAVEIEDGYVLESVKANDITLTLADNAAEYVVEDDTTITVTTKKLFNLTIEYDENTNQVKIEEEVHDCGEGKVTAIIKDGDTVAVKVTPKAGYRVLSVIIDDVAQNIESANDSGFEASLTITADTVIQVAFEKNVYVVTTDIGKNGTVTVADSVKYGESLQIGMQLDEGYMLDSFTINGEKIADSALTYQDDNRITYQVNNVTEHLQIQVSFTEVEVTNLKDAKVGFSSTGLVKKTVETKEEKTYSVRYYKAGSSVSVSMAKAERIAVNGEKLTGNKWTVTQDAAIESLEAFYQGANGYSGWHKVKLAGGSNEYQAVKIEIDDDAPVLGDLDEEETGVIYNDSFSVDVEITDPTTEIAKVTYSIFKHDKTPIDTDQELTSDNSIYTIPVKRIEEVYSGDIVIVVTAVDEAGNAASKEYTLQGDTILPVIEIAYENNEARNDKFFKNDRIITITYTEENFSIEDALNGIVIEKKNSSGEYETQNAEDWVEWKDSDNNDVHIAEIHFNESRNGDYQFAVSYTDLAGNTAVEITKVNADDTDDAQEPVATDAFVIDIGENPTGKISAEFYYKNEDTSKADHCLVTPWTELAKAEDPLNYKLWANESINIVIIDTNDTLSGVEKVEYFIDYYAKNNDLKFKESKDLDAASWNLVVDNKIPAIDTDNRFIVYLKITDNAGNYTYISTNGLIIDIHKPTGAYWGENIDIKVGHYAEEVNEEEKITKTQKELYGPNDTVKVDIEVYEPKYFGETQAKKENPEGVFSGLSTITYQITVDGEKQDVVTLFDAEKNINEDGATEVEVGLISKWIGSIEIDKVACNSNDVEVLVTAIDNAGNISQGTTKLMIDITDPVINVTYSETTDYSDQTRTAWIDVTERNFVPFELGLANELTDDVVNIEDMVNTIIATHGSEVEILKWEEIEVPLEDQKPNGDHKTRRLTVIFSKDDHYQISKLSTTDAVDNPSEEYAAGAEFTIDDTDPEITVSYDNNSALNGKYFKADRVATIQVTEHNFDPKLVTITIEPSRGGVKPALQEISDWEIDRDDSDVHIARFYFNVDGDYKFDISMTDLAGNECASGSVKYGNSVAAKDFVIDTDAEMITQSGVENGVAYGYDATVIPSIEIQDINLDDYTVSLVGIQKGKTIDLTEDVKALLNKGSQKITGIFDLFEKKQELDGIYTLTMTSKDLAGNEDSLEVIFTVNRYGSVYVYDQYLIDLIAGGGAFVQNVEGDLIMTEYNADKLLAGSLNIGITRDGKPLDNVKYEVSPEINDQVKPGDSGWYQYKYTISKDNFADDGIYRVSVSSEDATGNTPENSSYDDMGILFRVDHTKSDISSIVGLENAIIDAQEVNVRFTVFDSIGLKRIAVYLNGNLINEITDFSADSNNYDGSFTVKESTSAQSVRIEVEDLAGNITDTSSSDFKPVYSFNGTVTVSTNFFVRWYANQPLFWGSIAGFVALVAAVIFLIAGLKKRKANKK